jgi:hypothetical protein
VLSTDSLEKYQGGFGALQRLLAAWLIDRGRTIELVGRPTIDAE